MKGEKNDASRTELLQSRWSREHASKQMRLAISFTEPAKWVQEMLARTKKWIPC